MPKEFLITYDLKTPNKDYSSLYNAIKEYNNWQHPLESTWVIRVCEDTTVNDIYNTIRPCIDNNDYLFIIDITKSAYYGWMSKGFWTWFKK